MGRVQRRISKWTCLLQRIVLQDALNEVMKVYPLMKPKACVDDIRAFMEVRNEELRGVTEKVLRETFWECCKREGVGLATRVNIRSG